MHIHLVRILADESLYFSYEQQSLLEFTLDEALVYFIYIQKALAYKRSVRVQRCQGHELILEMREMFGEMAIFTHQI